MFSSIGPSAASTVIARHFARRVFLPLLLGAIAVGCSGEAGSTLIADPQEYLDALPDYPEPGPHQPQHSRAVRRPKLRI